jgi:hypothetical protein
MYRQPVCGWHDDPPPPRVNLQLRPFQYEDVSEYELMSNHRSQGAKRDL